MPDTPNNLPLYSAAFAELKWTPLEGPAVPVS